MKKADIILALITGLGVSFLFSGIIEGSPLKDALGIEISTLRWILALFLPLLSIFCLWIACLIGRRFLFVFQVAKFALIGVLATLLDLGIMNILIWIFGQATGWAFNVFKGISFLGATLAKYFGNKFLAFEKTEVEGVEKEFTQFFIVTLVGLAINVAVASLIVNQVGPQFGITPQVWANVGGIGAAIAGSAWNFLGYKFVVFKK